MFLCDQWRDCEVLDTGDGEKLERWGGTCCAARTRQVIWPKADPALWGRGAGHLHAQRHRRRAIRVCEKPPDRWVIGLNNLKFYVKPTGFKHTGLFPEQAANWAFHAGAHQRRGRMGPSAPGAEPLLSARACHAGPRGRRRASSPMDAAKGMAAWARENRDLSGPGGAHAADHRGCEGVCVAGARWGNRYDGILMDPPSYGRPGGVRYGS